MSSIEERHENGSVVMVIGWVMMLFAFLVCFFIPRPGDTVRRLLRSSPLAWAWQV
jgi:hypothetical protein